MPFMNSTTAEQLPVHLGQKRRDVLHVNGDAVREAGAVQWVPRYAARPK